PLSCVSFSKLRAKLSEYQVATSAGVLALSGNPAAEGNAALTVVSRKRISAVAMWRTSSMAVLANGSGRDSALSAGTASRIFLVVRLSFLSVPSRRSCSQNSARSGVSGRGIWASLAMRRVYRFCGRAAKAAGTRPSRLSVNVKRAPYNSCGGDDKEKDGEINSPLQREV